MIGFLWARTPACKRAMAGQIGGTPLLKVYQLKRPESGGQRHLPG
jgi:hypothetical protein